MSAQALEVHTHGCTCTDKRAQTHLPLLAAPRKISTSSGGDSKQYAALQDCLTLKLSYAPPSALYTLALNTHLLFTRMLRRCLWQGIPKLESVIVIEGESSKLIKQVPEVNAGEIGGLEYAI